MRNYENLKVNKKIIEDICKKYRKELTVYGGVFGEALDKVVCDDYIKFMNELSDDMFVGSYFTGLVDKEAIDAYEQILNGKKTFVDFIEIFGLKEEFLKKMEELD